MSNKKKYCITETLTKKTILQQKKLLKIFAKLNIEQQIEIINMQNSLFHKLKNYNKEVSNAILTLSSLILAVDSVVKEIDSVSFNALKLKNKNPKSKIKKEKLLSYWAVVRTLKLEENMSFRDISSYLKKYHKFEVSYSLIYQKWQQIEGARINNEFNN